MANEHKYKEKIEECPQRNPPIVYIPTKPSELFEKYRDTIREHVDYIWPTLPDDFILQPRRGVFYYYDYGGQYTFTCELPKGFPPCIRITVTESFEKEDEQLANDDDERRRRLIVSVS